MPLSAASEVLVISFLLALSLPANAQVYDTGEPPPPVVNGELVSSGDWEDAAAIYYGSWVECTGVLIAPTVVVTANHCLETRATAVRVGTNNYNSGGEKISVKSQEAYPGSWWNTYDMGVLILDEPAETEPRLIAQGCILDEYLENGAPVTVVGYGATDYYGNNYDSKLREGFTTVDDYDCTEMPGCLAKISPGGELGAGADDNVYSCYGDSGGPLYLNTERGDFLIGTTSRSYDGVSVPCRDGGIYVRTDAVLDWIEDVTGVEIPLTTCNSAPEPEDLEEEVDAGDTIEIDLEANDPDKGDSHTYEIVEDPDDGDAEIDDDVLIYEADGDASGKDRLIIKVTDDGDPEMSATFEVEIDVQERSRVLGCGCSAGPGSAGAGSAAVWLLGLLGLGWRRRR